MTRAAAIIAMGVAAAAGLGYLRARQAATAGAATGVVLAPYVPPAAPQLEPIPAPAVAKSHESEPAPIWSFRDLLFGSAGVPDPRQAPARRPTFGLGPDADRLSPRLVVALADLDTEIRALGGQLRASPIARPGARRDGPDNTSQHNIDRWGEGRAFDVQVAGVPLREAYDAARRLRVFSGLGVYPDWRPAPGLHVDVRPDRSPDSPATWAGRLVGGRQVTSLPVSAAWTA